MTKATIRKSRKVQKRKLRRYRLVESQPDLEFELYEMRRYMI
jgi:hypothetical protein